MQNDYYWEEEELIEEPRAAGRSWIPLILLVALLVCSISAVVTPGALGFLAGYGQLQEQNHENAIQHFERGLGFLADNYPELAYTEFEIALRYDPSYEPAGERLKEMQQTVIGPGTPDAAEENRVADALYQESQDLSARKEWGEAILRLEQLRTLNAGYRPIEVGDLLYRAYVEGGRAALVAKQIELARERFDAALAIRGTDAEVIKQRDLAVLYLDGQQAVGYSWPVAITKFQQLYQLDPNYDDVRTRLADAYAQYGDVAAKQGAWCLAAREYDGALAVLSDPQVTSKRTQAMSACRQAISVTPSPVPPTGSETYFSRITRDNGRACNAGTGDVSGVVRDALNQPLAGIAVGYYADGINRVSTRTNTQGQYQFTWGVDPGLFHVIIMAADGKTQVGVAADVEYAGGNKAGCHVIVDWQKVQ